MLEEVRGVGDDFDDLVVDDHFKVEHGFGVFDLVASFADLGFLGSFV